MIMRGVVAAAAGLAVLLGGAGSFALWNGAVGADAHGAASAGDLRVEGGEVTWRWTDASGEVIPDIAQVAIVPGDTLYYAAHAKVTATDERIAYTIEIYDTDFEAGGLGRTLLHAPSVTKQGVAVNGPQTGSGTYDIAGTLSFDAHGQTAAGARGRLKGIEVVVRQALPQE